LTAPSSKVVLMKFAPEPPTAENNGTCVPSGAINTALSPESVGKAMLSVTVILAMVKVPLKLGMVKGAERTPGPVVAAAGIDWPKAVGLKVCGPVTGPTGPMIERTWPGVNVLTWTGRSKVTVYRLVVSLSSKRSLLVESCPEVPTACVLATCG